MSKLSDSWNKFTNSIWSWFHDTSKYSKQELVLNWIIGLNLAILLILDTIMLCIYGYRFIAGLKGEFPIYLWCPVWASVVMAIQVVIEIIVCVEKFRERRKRLKYDFTKPTPERKKYKPVDETKGSKKKRFD